MSPGPVNIECEIYTIPILGKKNKMAYFAQHNEKPHPPVTLSWIETLQSRKWKTIVGKVFTFSEEQWKLLESAKPNSIRGYCYKGAKLLMQTISPEEIFLRSTPTPGPNKTIDYTLYIPYSNDQEEIMSRFKKKMSVSMQEQKRWFYINACLLPVTFLCFLIPGPPNVPFYWNAFRTWGRYKAMIAAKSLLSSDLKVHQSIKLYNLTKGKDDLEDPMDDESLLRVNLTIQFHSSYL